MSNMKASDLWEGDGNWIIRDRVKQSLADNMSSITDACIDSDVDYKENLHFVAGVVEKYLGDIDFTRDEFEFVMTNVQIHLIFQSMIRDGEIEVTEDGLYKIRTDAFPEGQNDE